MLRAWERGRPARMLAEPFLGGAETPFFVAFLNHEITKRLEIHEIFASRISRILWDSTEKSLLWLNPLC